MDERLGALLADARLRLVVRERPRAVVPPELGRGPATVPPVPRRRPLRSVVRRVLVEARDARARLALGHEAAPHAVGVLERLLAPLLLLLGPRDRPLLRLLGGISYGILVMAC